VTYAVPRPGPRAVVELWDGRWWPCAGFYAQLPVFRFQWAPSGLATVRQLAAVRVRPGGQEVTAWLAWGRRSWPRWASLYRLDLAKPKRTPTPAQLEALAKATAARRRCGHAFGSWLACGCGQGIATHQDGFFADGSCAFEFRSCLCCPAAEERHVTEIEPPTVPDLGRPNSSPGGPSAKTLHRAGFANHQNDSQDQLDQTDTGEHGTTTEGTDPR
jgi:hypothetical protein